MSRLGEPQLAVVRLGKRVVHSESMCPIVAPAGRSFCVWAKVGRAGVDADDIIKGDLESVRDAKKNSRANPRS